ncbi:MAG: sulfite oxidase, partial [Burkholderiaceae bacterium]
MKTETDLSRRRLLASSGALAAAGLAGASRAVAQTSPSAQPPAPAKLPAYVAWKDADALIIHTPTTIETKRSAFGTGMITPAERLYIRNNIAAPDPSIVANR